MSDHQDMPRSFHESAPQSEPHLGHGGTSYEGTDAKAGLVIGSLAVIGGTLIIVFAFTVGIQKYLEKNNPIGELPSRIAPARIVPPSPQLQVHPWEELPDRRANEEKILNSSSTDPDGRVHIPITQAMNNVVPRLNVHPGAMPGLTTPGGEGRTFAGSVNSMPPEYRRPQIQEEIHKRAH